VNNRGIKKDPSAGDWWYSAVQYIMELAWCRVLVSLITLSSNTYIKSFFALLDISDTLLRVGSEGRPESEVRKSVGVGLTEYTEEGNG